MRGATILFVAIAGLLSFALFSVKYQVADLEGQLNDINRSIARDHQAIHVLKAEWSFLNDPQRLRDLVRKYLTLVPVEGAQIETFDMLPPRAAIHPVAGPAAEDNAAVVPAATGRHAR